MPCTCRRKEPSPSNSKPAITKQAGSTRSREKKFRFRRSMEPCGLHANARGRTTSNSPPRKVIVGTVMQAFWGQYPGLPKRLDQLAGIVDQMVAQAEAKYHRGLDLAVLPETAITGEAESDAWARSVPFEGQVREVFSRKARERGCYIVVPTYLLDSKEKKRCSNAAVLVGRKGEVLGTYRKVHLVVSLERGTMEGGSTPGEELPVFDCDFGKLAIQICYDMEFADGWRPQLRAASVEFEAAKWRSPPEGLR